MLIHENEKTRNNLQKQLMDGKMVSAEDSPEEYQMVSDLEIKIDITKKSLKIAMKQFVLLSYYNKH